MNTMTRTGRSYRQAAGFCLAVLAAMFASQYLAAADAVNLEGTWKITAVQDSFKPEGGSVPFTQKGRKRYQDNKRSLAQRNYDDFDYMTARCASPGLPRLMLTPDRFRIWQRDGLTLFQFEWNRLFRQIDMGGLIPQFNMSGANAGDDAAVGRAVPISKGHWEGETLVVTTEGFNETTLVDNLVPHGYDLKLTERIRLKNADTLEDRITIEDPEFFTKPWETVVTYRRQADAAFPEKVCLDTLPNAQLPVHP
jgi:hypothetical protein